MLTVTLLAFLVLILVALATLTRVETQVATNHQQLTQARQNALMALNIALGQLQKYAGPDQRTTARADIDATLANTTTANGRWTGVYGNAVAADYNASPEDIAKDLTEAANITPKGSPARLLNWLVSGNEKTSFDPTTDVADDGHIKNAPTAFAFAPDSTVDLTALSTNPTPQDTQTLLVGSNSVTAPDDYVGAPLVKVEVPESAIAGFSASSTALQTIGRYAWWVGDEGMKARMNLPLAGSDATLNADEKLEEQRNAFSNSTRAAIELMASDDRNDWATTPPTENLISGAYDPAAASLTHILSTSQLPMMASNATTAVTLRTATQHRFHDLTPYSYSVLSDTYAGGLKRDLSILLDENYTPDANDPTANSKRLWTLHSGDTTGFVPGGGFYVPTWKHLRSYAQTRIPTTGSNAFSLAPRLPANDKTGWPDDVGVGPVITYFSLGFRAAPAAAPSPDVEIHMNLYPLVVIWNPYNFTLRAPSADPQGGNYEVGIVPGHDGSVTVNLQVESIGADGAITWPTRGTFDFQRSSAGTLADYEYIRFRLNCGDILPGQSLIFSLPSTSTGQIYNQRNVLENIEPEPGAYVSIPFRKGSGTGTPVTIIAGEEDANYRLSASGSFGSGNGGGVNFFVGEPNSVARLNYSGGTTAATRLARNPSNPTHRWYNIHQGIGWDNVAATSPLQGPGPLAHESDAEPSYVFLGQALFSGHGRNARLFLNQHMFTTRWLAQGNMRAVRTGRTRRDSNYNVLFTANAGSIAKEVPWQKFNSDEGPASNRASAGRGHDWIGGAPVDAKLFEFPYQNQPLFSIGQLQHANLSLVGAYPAYPIGNSLADFRLHGPTMGSRFAGSIPRGYQLARVDKATSESSADLQGDMVGYYDISYLLNRTLWDRYYFSTVPATGAVPTTLANPRHIRHDTSVDLQNPDRSASGLVLAGGFNINSTSEQAWRAVLGGGNQVVFDPKHPDTAASPATHTLKSSFPRFTRPASDDDTSGLDAWEGYRALDENQIAQLARNIVAEIRNRGPFVSLADFVNRRVTMDTTADISLRGPIQAAIDGTALSSAADFPANDAGLPFWTEDELARPDGTPSSYHNQGTQYTYGHYNQIQLEGGANPAKPYGNRSAFAPKYLTQADVLATIGASLSARSDTFTIRTYGDVVNPVTQEINGRAWCEAVVQRFPEYVEETVNAWDRPANGSPSQKFGRKFKIVSFRWLSSDDI